MKGEQGKTQVAFGACNQTSGWPAVTAVSLWYL